MLNEVTVKERASTQAVLLIFISIGQLTGSALVVALASSVRESQVSGLHSWSWVFSSFILVIT